MSSTIDPQEIPRLQRYFQTKFKNEGFALKMRDRVNNSVEVILNGEHIGVLYKDEDEGELSYHFQMSILDIDLKDA